MGQRGPATCSIIIPTLDEAATIARSLRLVRERAPGAEVIVVDGESRDATAALARPLADQVIVTRRGRGRQINAGARAAGGEVLLMLHADTVPDAGGVERMLAALAEPEVLGGAFRLRFDDPRPVYAAIAEQIARRSLRTKSYTGDQAIFIRRAGFFDLDGCRPWQFMEDVDLSERMARRGRNVLLDASVETSARRHRRWGLPRTQATVVLIRALYLARVHPDRYAWLWPEVRECVE
ncbi:MAG TPA: TIGR04283 family arsenosugar biosynthesis glycosyltransferase [Ktedonobacterales bacterium]|jgi:rSAM/selenodomain-associated transferase 2